MKKITAFALALAMALSLAACGGSKTPSQQPTENQTTEPAAEKTVTLKMASGYGIDHVITKCGDEIAARVKEKSNGSIIIEHFPSNQLGSTNERSMMLLGGDVDINLEALSEYDSYNPEQGVVSAFFMFKNWDHYKKFMVSDLYKGILSDLEKAAGITYLGEVYTASRQMITNKEVTSLADLQGLKMRVPNQEMPIAFVNAIGAVAVPLPGSETYTACQNGTVSGLENGAEQIVTQAFYEVAPYMIYTNHQIQTITLFMNNESKAKLSDNQYQILSEVIAEVTSEYNELARNAEKEKEAFLEETITCSTIDLTDFYAACESAYEEYDSVWGDGVWEQIRAMAE